MERKRVKQIIFLFLVVPLLWGINSTVFAADMNAAMEECLNNEVQKAGDAVTIGELRAKCKAEERAVELHPFFRKSTRCKPVQVLCFQGSLVSPFFAVQRLLHCHLSPKSLPTP